MKQRKHYEKTFDALLLGRAGQESEKADWEKRYPSRLFCTLFFSVPLRHRTFKKNNRTLTLIPIVSKPECSYESRLAVCEGYSNLTISLMRAAGLKCYNESGRANNGLHGWNVAYLDGKWVVIDNTWDSPLEYEKTDGSGYQCRYDDPDLIWEWRTPEDIWEPNASRRNEKVHFNMDHDSFYTSHRLLRDPTLGSRSVLNVKDVLP